MEGNKVTLKEYYLNHEKNIIEQLLKKIIDNFCSDGKAYYLDKYRNRKENEYLELDKISIPAETISLKRRNNNPVEWEVSFKLLRNAIKITLRFGKILRPTDYLTMNGKSNFIGTPLHILVSMLDEKEYQQNSLVGKKITHTVFGEVRVLGIDYPKDIILIETQLESKMISMEYFQITEKEFEGLFNE